MTYALVKNGICENVILADEEFIKTITEYETILCDGLESYGIGMRWDGTQFVTE